MAAQVSVDPFRWTLSASVNFCSLRSGVAKARRGKPAKHEAIIAGWLNASPNVTVCSHFPVATQP